MVILRDGIPDNAISQPGGVIYDLQAQDPGRSTKITLIATQSALSPPDHPDENH